MPPLSAAAPFPDLVEESLDEATFLWRRWEGELSSLTRNISDVWSWTEDRLHGALDGVHLGGAVGDAVMNGLLSAEPERIAACTAVLASSEPGAVKLVTQALAAADGGRLRAMMRGLELLGSKAALRAAAQALDADAPARAAALCRLAWFRRTTPGAELQAALRSDDPDAQADAIRAAVLLPESTGDALVAAAQRSPVPHVRQAAIEAGLSRGLPQSLAAAREAAERHGPAAGSSLRLLAMLGGAAEHDVVYAALRVPALQRDAIWALGHIATPRAVEACLAGMKYGNVARACGESYCHITGADLERDGLAVREVLADAPPFEEDDLDADLVPPAGDLWPLPDADAVRRDWTTRAPQFAADVRHVRGRPGTRDAFIAAVEQGPMLRRHDLVFELRARTRGQYDVETRAFTSRQRQMMAAARAAAGGG